MKKVTQRIVNKGNGDCMRAAIASLFELELEAVPHFMLLPDKYWWDVLIGFFWGCGYTYQGNVSSLASRGLLIEDSIEGYFYCCVPSKTLKGCGHAVVIDIEGIVVHDPNPNRRWLGESVLDVAESYWYTFKKRENEL